MAENLLKNITQERYYQLRVGRWKARTDLGWLCREVLNYPDVSDDNGGTSPGLHTPIIDRLQKFPLPNQQQFSENDILVNGKWVYKPIMPMLDLPGQRRRLILDSRSHLKTTVNSIAHTIQCILNYPEIAILVLMGQDTKAADVLGEIKRHFQFNPRFRELFPDHCPQKGINDWGRADRFTSEARPKSDVRKEPTVMTGSVEKGAAGYHFHIIKFSDIVDENNIAGDGLTRVLNKFDISLNLLIGPKYWMDVEGTRYHFGDVYGEIIERETKTPPEKREYVIFVRGVYKRKVEGGEKFLPEEANAPFLLDKDGSRIPWWPQRFTIDSLEREESNNPWLFACQKLNAPAMNVEGSTPFPVDGKFPRKITRDNYENNIRISYKDICVDLASTDGPRSNNTCITVGSFSSSGKVYVEEIEWGKFLADEAVKRIFRIALKHYRHLRAIKIEESEYLRGLMPSIMRELDTVYRPKGINFEIETIKRGNRTHKADRIHKALQPWYKNGNIVFLDDIDQATWTRLVKEMVEFPASKTDDILDTLADLVDGKEYYGREMSRGNPLALKRDPITKRINDPIGVNRIFRQVQNQAFDKLLKLEDPYKEDEFTAFSPSSVEFFTNPGQTVPYK